MRLKISSLDCRRLMTLDCIMVEMKNLVLHIEIPIQLMSYCQLLKQMKSILTLLDLIFQNTELIPMVVSEIIELIVGQVKSLSITIMAMMRNLELVHTQCHLVNMMVKKVFPVKISSLMIMAHRKVYLTIIR